jgi:hypothetical protein
MGWNGLVQGEKSLAWCFLELEASGRPLDLGFHSRYRDLGVIELARINIPKYKWCNTGKNIHTALNCAYISERCLQSTL